MKGARRITWLLISITLLASIACQKDPWLDDQGFYLCPDCQDKAYVYLAGTCERCGETIASASLRFCYDCAKEIDMCQRCGIAR